MFIMAEYESGQAKDEMLVPIFNAFSNQIQ
jgi:hypothetical protein